MANVLSQFANQGQFATGLDRPSSNPIGQWAQGVAQRTMNPLATLAAEADRYRTMPPEELLGQFGGGGVGATAYHGSPHLFDKFKSEAIGTGEGAQAYGHGLYLAENPAVAEGYQKANVFRAFDIAPEAEKRGLKLSSAARGELTRQARANADPMQAAKKLQYANATTREIPQEKLADLIEGYQKAQSGQLYKTDIPDTHINKMLDWDKPLSEQSKEVQESVRPLMDEWASKMQQYDPEIVKKYKSGKITGNQINSALGTGSSESAADVLHKAGIPGIKYLDAGSREAGGTSNFVMFNPSDIRILERNNIPTGEVPWSETNRLSQMAGEQ